MVKKSYKKLIFALILGFFFLYIDFYWASLPYEAVEEQIQAARLMENCEKEIFQFARERKIPFNSLDDPNNTGLIGPDFAEFTTTTGNIAAKRTSVDPVFAAVMIRYFHELGLKSGDVIAIGASGSFPGLVLATLCAVKVMELEPIIIYSLGASSYGAGLYNFTAMEMIDFWREKNLLPYTVQAFSMGGGNDLADDIIFPEYQQYFLQKGEEYKSIFIHEANLEKSEQKRRDLYKDFAAVKGKKEEEIACFVNIGGASVNAGNASLLTSLNNGILLPSKENLRFSDSYSGLATYYLEKQIPVIHLLNIRDIALKNNVPIDSMPFQPVGQGKVYEKEKNTLPRGIFLGIGLFIITSLCFSSRKK